MKRSKSARPAKAKKEKSSAIGQKLKESLKDALKFESGENTDLRTQLLELTPVDDKRFLESAKKLSKNTSTQWISSQNPSYPKTWAYMPWK